MGRCRVVAPETGRITISDGDWIEVKKVLNAGEYRKLLYDQFKDAPGGDTITLDHAKIGISKLLAYLLRWSLLGMHDHPIPYGLEHPEDVRRAALDSLDQDTYRELIAAIAAHEAQQDAKIESQKKTSVTGPAS